jgi:hypothetical protein
VVHHLGAFAESAVCAFHFWEDFQGHSKTGFPVVVFLQPFPLTRASVKTSVMLSGGQNGR